MQRILFTMLMVILFIPALAQKNGLENMAVAATIKKTGGWYLFNKGYNVNAAGLNAQLHTAGILPVELELKQKKQETDELGFTHTWFQQFYKGYFIESADLVLHEKPGTAPLFIGEVAFEINKQPAASISFNTALTNAQKNFPVKKYAWENPVEEKSLAQRTKGRQKTYFPGTLLVWVAQNNNNSVTYLLCYKISMASYDVEITRDIYIDAINGSLVKSINTTCNYDIPFNSVFNGAQSGVSTFVTTGENGFPYNNFQMIAPNIWGNKIYTSDNLNFYTPIMNPTNTWENNTLNNSAFSSQWATLKVMEYYKNIHNRSGFDGSSFLDIDQRQNAGFIRDSNIVYYSNASFNATGIMKIGNNESAGPQGNNSNAIDDWNSFDIIGHEFTHGVTAYTAALVYEKEPGALNESFSDIFGASSYLWFNPANSNAWLCGYDRKNPVNPSISLYLRNMTNPNDKGQPDTYKGSGWISTTTPADSSGDKWGVHTNSGVQNYMFYLLVMGGSGTNDNGLAFSVSGIGIIKARLIAYRSLAAGYLTQNSGYTQSRAAWIRSAEDLYGVCSSEAKAVAYAWQAVGVDFNSFHDPVNFCGTYGSSQYGLSTQGAILAANGCSTLVNPSAYTSLVSSTVIFIYPGFTAGTGSNFQAYIDASCEITDY